VRDSAVALDVLQGPQPGDPFVIAPPAGRYADLMLREPGRLKIGFTARSPIGTEVHAEAVAAVRNAAALLEKLGHDVEEAEPDIDGAALASSYLHIYFGQVPAVIARAKAAGAGTGDFELLTRLLMTMGRSRSAVTLTEQLGEWNSFSRALGQFHQRYDLLLTPTLAHPPVRHGETDPPAAQQAVLGFLQRTGLLGLMARVGMLDGLVGSMARDSLRYVPFTQLANLTGTPAMSVPLHWTADGLPLGVQFIGRFGSEDMLLQLAHQLEQAQPWFNRLPGWVASGASAA
jgi:amidase